VDGKPVPGGGAPGSDVPEGEPYRILRSRIDLSRLAPLSRAVTEHVIVASADFDFATDLVCDERMLAGAVAALAAGASVVADTVVVAAGIAGHPVVCKSEETLTVRLARTAGISRPAAAVRLAFGDAGPGAVWLVGGSAAALDEVMARNVQPALVVGVPSGLVGAAEAKDALRASGLPALSNVSEKGGAAVAAAAFEALLRSAVTVSGSRAGAGERAPGPDGGSVT